MTQKSLSRLFIFWPFLFSLCNEIWAAEIVGRVTDADSGQAIPYAIVRAIPQRGQRQAVQVTAHEDGRYHLELLRGKYKLFISVPNSNYLPLFYSASNQESGDIIDIPTFQSFTIINASLISGGSISGSVRRWIDDVPISNIRIYAEAPNFRVSVNTQEDGSYIFRGLPPNHYKIHVVTLDENYVSVYFDDALDSRKAESIHLERQREISGIDFRLRYGGVISGRVYARKNREPIANLKVIAEKQNSEEFPLFTYTDAQGFYVLRGVPDGQYTVESGTLRDSNTQSKPSKHYLVQYHNGRFEKELAAKLDIISGSSVTGVDFSLVEGGKIAGAVYSKYHHSPIPGVGILPEDANKEILNPPRGKTNTVGQFLIKDVVPGEYILDTSLPKQSQRFVRVFYRDKLSLERADRIRVDEGGWLRNIDFNLALGATLKGWFKVDEPDYKFNPAGDTVILKRVGTDLEGFGQKDFKLAADGSFTIEGTPPGRYSLIPKMADPNVLSRQNLEANILEVVEGETVENLEFVLKVGGSISGTISTQSNLYSLDKLLLILISSQENTKTYFDVSSEHYTIAGIDPGRYVLVLLSKPEITPPNSNFQPTRIFDMRLVEVSKGKTTSGIDFQIASSAEKLSGLLP